MKTIGVDVCEKEIRDYADQKNMNPGYTEYCNGILATIGVIKNQPIIEIPQWIPVEKRLPENDNDILIFYKDDIHLGWYDNGFSSYSEWEDTNVNNDVLFWMKLPDKPYQKGTQ